MGAPPYFKAVSDPDEPAGLKPPGQGHSLGLRLKFQLGLAAIFIGFGIVIAGLIYTHERRLLQDSALNTSRLVMASVESARAYVRDTLRPRMYRLLGPEAFVLEAMSTSYVSRVVMDHFGRTLPEYRYRRVALRARNPQSSPTPMELELITYFASHPGQNEWQGMRTVAGALSFVHARPVVMASSCLNCHGDPDQAPRDLIAQYGNQRGFGYLDGELAGIMAVSIPVEVALQQIKARALSVFWVTLLLLTVLYLFVCFLFDRMVVRSLQALLAIFRSGMVDDRERALLREASAKDEIGELTDAARVLTDHLKSARQELARHAEQLEQRVVERTGDLEASQQHLHDQVQARNRELTTLNHIAELITRFQRLEEILPAVLDETLGLIPACGAAIYLFKDHADPSRLTLACQRNAENLDPLVSNEEIEDLDGDPESLKAAIWQAAKGRLNLFACRRHRNCLNVPLICRKRVLGVMTFVGVDFRETTSEMKALLQSIGQQIGITVESLQNVAALVQSKELLQSVFDGIPDMMVLLDRDLTIHMMNRAFLARHGEPLRQVLGKHCGAGDRSCGDALAGTRLQETLTTRRQTREEIRTAAGEIFSLYYYPILDDAGEVWGVLRFARDITLEKQVEQRIQQTEKMAALGQLAAGLAHEINNPMGVILCYTDLLRRGLPGNDQALRDVETIDRQARTCKRILSDLLKFARIRGAERRPGDINQALGEVLEMLRSQFAKQGTRIETCLSPDLPRLCFDVGKLKQVFLNLLINAHQATAGRQGCIAVSTRHRTEAGTVEIVFRDNGTGIPADIMQRIFDPFFSTKGTGEGTGLGLSVSYGIVRDHDGEILVASEADRWTEFTVVLPVTSEERSATDREGKG